mmetsp:Transcript_68885/g.183497  ORF Transcript_68885/g.183497 Transcript_68885/m.183497 type:complete len:118 (+) Transcript_68885:532-885(+)
MTGLFALSQFLSISVIWLRTMKVERLSSLTLARSVSGMCNVLSVLQAIRPRKGMAVMWNNRKPSGEEDELMRHEAQAPTKSIKFGLNCFVNEKPRQVVYVTKTGEILGSGPAGRYAA